MLSQVLCPALSPFLDTPACQSLLSTGITRLHWYYGLIRLPVPRPQTSFPQFQVPLCRGRYRSSQVPRESLQQHAVDYDPGGVSAISPLNDDCVAAFSVLNHLGLLHNISIFGAEHLHPSGLRPAVFLFTLHPYGCPHRRKTRFRRSANFVGLASQPTGFSRLCLAH
jgi:hypothetical protein